MAEHSTAALAEDPPTIEWSGLYGPSAPRLGVLEAIRRHKLVFAIPVVIAIVAGLGVTKAVKSTYTSQAALNIDAANLGASGALMGFATASQTLASSYARAITSTSVIVPAAKKLGYAPNSVAGAVVATPVPQSPLIEVIAQTHDAKTSVAVANAVAKQSVKYFGQSGNTSNATAVQYYGLFKAAQKKLQATQVAAQTAQKNYFKDNNAANSAALAKARAKAQSLVIQTEGYRQNYINAVRGEVNVATVTLLSTATQATSNAKKRLELNLFIALVAGLFVGAALATYRANAVLRRAFVAGHHGR